MWWWSWWFWWKIKTLLAHVRACSSACWGGVKFSKPAASSQIISQPTYSWQPLFNSMFYMGNFHARPSFVCYKQCPLCIKKWHPSLMNKPARAMHWCTYVANNQLHQYHLRVGTYIANNQFHQYNKSGSEVASNIVSKVANNVAISFAKNAANTHINITTQGGDGGTPKCIEKSKLCDGKKDCQDGADEKNACCKS